jgi:hypothetical protein
VQHQRNTGESRNPALGIRDSVDLRGLGGNPVVDLDQDEFVTFEELSEHTTRYVALAAEGMPTTVTTGKFDRKFRLAKATGKAGLWVGELVERKRKGDWLKAEILENTPKGVKIHYTRNTKPADDEISQIIAFQRWRLSQKPRPAIDRLDIQTQSQPRSDHTPGLKPTGKRSLDDDSKN